MLSRYAKAYESVLKERDTGEGARHMVGKKNVEERGAWCSGCGLLVVLLRLAYLYVLGHFLYHVATEGEWVWSLCTS